MPSNYLQVLAEEGTVIVCNCCASSTGKLSVLVRSHACAVDGAIQEAPAAAAPAATPAPAAAAAAPAEVVVDKAVGLFDYVARNSGELSFKTGEGLLILDKSDAWWVARHAVHQDQKGRVPSTYVAPVVETVKALYDYTPAPEHAALHMSMMAGDVILVFKKADSGWWEGASSRGSKGVFPYNYTQVVPSTIERKGTVSRQASGIAIE